MGGPDGEGIGETRKVVELGIPGYDDLSRIGQGGFATVYRAWQAAFERHVAIKVIDTGVDPHVMGRFERECAAIGALSGHPHIVTVYDHGRATDGRPFIVMEFLSGGSLADSIKRQGPVPWASVTDIGIKLAGALESAHHAKVLHRDIKPENVMLSRFREPKLGDFGIARVEGRTQTNTNSITASVAHAPPEVLDGKPPTVASDVYSLGSTLFTLLAGHPPFVRPTDESLSAVLARVMAGEVPDLRPSGVPAALGTVVEQAMARDPLERPPSATALGRQLQAVQAAAGLPVTPLLVGGDDGEGVDAPPAPAARPAAGPVATARRKARRTPWLAAAVAILVAAILVALLLRSSGGGGTVTAGGPASTADQPATTEARTGGILFQDDFASPRGWQTSDTNAVAKGVTGGEYSMLLKTRGRVATAVPAGLAGGDVRVEADAYRATALAAELGVFCRGSADDLRVHYEARIATAGSWRIVKLVGNTLTTLASGRDVAGGAIRPSGANRVGFDCRNGGDTPVVLRLSVNGRVLGEIQDRNGLTGPQVGLVAEAIGEGAEVRFDNIVVSSL